MGREPVQGQARKIPAILMELPRAADANLGNAALDPAPADRLRQAQVGRMKMKSEKLRTTFTAMYTDVMNSEAWKAMTKPIAAKVLLLEMKALYNRKTEAAVPMSVRYAAKLLGIHTQLAGQCLDALEHYGFIKETKRGYLGVDGCGLATEWQLTDEIYLGNPATLDFKRWKGTPYRSPKLKARSDNHHRPVKKARKYGNFPIQPPVVKINTHLEVYPSSTPDPHITPDRK